MPSTWIRPLEIAQHASIPALWELDLFKARLWLPNTLQNIPRSHWLSQRHRSLPESFDWALHAVEAPNCQQWSDKGTKITAKSKETVQDCKGKWRVRWREEVHVKRQDKPGGCKQNKWWRLLELSSQGRGQARICWFRRYGVLASFRPNLPWIKCRWTSSSILYE